MEEDLTDAIRAAARSSGAAALLCVTGSATSLQGTTPATAAALVDAMEAGGYDGLFLNLGQLAAQQRARLTALVSALRQILGDKPLYLLAEAPSWQGRNYAGYDYAALAAQVDRLVLRVTSYEEMVGTFPTAPMEPLEEIYYALGELNGTVPAEKLSLLVTTTGSAWTNGRRTASPSAERLAELLTDPDTETYYSQRYGCAYLTQGTGAAQTVVWYLDEEAAAARVRLAAFFGVDQLCLSDLTSVSPALSAALEE